MVRLRTGAATNSLLRPGSAQAVSSLRHRRQQKQVLLRNGTSLHPVPKNTTISPPPPGYTFLSMGHPDLSTKCKELSKEKNADVSVVSATNRDQEDSRSISHHLHRIGYHIRTDIFDEACTWLGYREVNGKLIKDPVFDPTSGFERTLARYGADLSQLGAAKATNEQSEKVKGAIRELFPKIPEQSLNDIFETAWQKGAQTVGNVDSLPLSRRVQLAVVAHIRHMHTDYDRILQASSWRDARKAVEPYCLAKLVEWRGEDDADDDAIDDILQHAILLSDEESPAEHSEPDRYADNEDSNSEEADELAHRASHAADVGRTASAFARGPSLLPYGGGAVPNRASHMSERQRQMMRARFQDARMRARESTHPILPGSSTMAPNAAYLRLPEVRVPIDHKGRAPRRFIENGMEFTRATREQLAPYGIIPPVSTSHGEPFSQQTSFAAPSSVHAPVPHAHPRLFDEHGREVFLDPSIHQLTPAHTLGTTGFSSEHLRRLHTPQPLSGIHPRDRIRTLSPESTTIRASRMPSQSLAVTKASKKDPGYLRYSDTSDNDDEDDEDDEYDPSKPMLSSRRLSAGYPPATSRRTQEMLPPTQYDRPHRHESSTMHGRPSTQFGVFTSATPHLPYGASPLYSQAHTAYLPFGVPTVTSTPGPGSLPSASGHAPKYPYYSTFAPPGSMPTLR